MITIEDMVQKNTDLLLELQQDVKKLLGKNSDIPDEWISGEEAAKIFKIGYVHFMNFWKPKFPISQLKRVGRNVYFDRAAVLAAAKDRETSVDPVEYRSQESAAKSADIHEESSQLLRQYRQANAI